MNQMTPSRIAIIGMPGSGKSTFALKLGKALHLPVHHLDTHAFVDGEKRDLSEFIAIQQSLVDSHSWIIEGCSIATLHMRFARADLVLYLDFPRHLCLWRAFKRFFINDEELLETGCLKGVNWTLLKYIWNFNQAKRSSIEILKEIYHEVPFLVFKDAQEAEKFVTKIVS